MLGQPIVAVNQSPTDQGVKLADRTVSPGVLHVVATPIGNLEDVTLRALRVLREVDLIACEDTRRTAALLRRHGISTPTTSYFEQNERFKSARILAALLSGRSVALVSDAGTPGLSDPGYRLVREARIEGLVVLPVPGPSAAVAAASVSGLPTDRILFVGFLPSRPGSRRRALRDLAGEAATLVFFESPVRILATLGDMIDLLGDREAFLCREATKVHEEYVLARLAAVRARLAARDAVRGEIVLVVAGADAAARETGGDPPAAEETLEVLFARLTAEGRTRREAVKEVARRLHLSARDVYQRVLETKAAGKSNE
jgi:16S rRNA (cytidine1402-2'-O)-methyltransferase